MTNSLIHQIEFPRHIFQYAKFPEEFQSLIGDLEKRSCYPTYPWAQHFYYTLIRKLDLPVKGMAAEFGVAKGGMSIFLGRLFKAQDKKTHAFDTFTGAPFSSGSKEQPYYKMGDYQNVGELSQLPQFQESLRTLNLEEFVIPHQGDFSAQDFSFQETGSFSFVHIDCNLYESTKAALKIIWDKVIDGGVIVLDEFFHSSAGVKTAAQEFFTEKGIRPVYHVVFPYSVVIIKAETPENSFPDIEGNFYQLNLLADNECFMDALKTNIKVLERGPFPTLDNAKLLWNVLSKPTTSHEVHLYLWLMRDFWNGFYQSPDAYQQRGLITK